MLGVVFSTSVEDIVLIDYENKLKEMEKLLNAWSRRNITLFGKVTVIKTLVISKITHLFTNLPDPDEKFLQDLNLLLTHFSGMANMIELKALGYVKPMKLVV